MKTALKLFYLEKTKYSDPANPTIALWKVSWDCIGNVWDNYLSCVRVELLSHHIFSIRLTRLLRTKESKSLILVKKIWYLDGWWRGIDL
jgi:hypothetical protein